MQEVITRAVFAVFAVVVLKEPLGWRYVGAVACIIGAGAFMFAGRSQARQSRRGTLLLHCNKNPLRAFSLRAHTDGADVQIFLIALLVIWLASTAGVVWLYRHATRL